MNSFSNGTLPLGHAFVSIQNAPLLELPPKRDCGHPSDPDPRLHSIRDRLQKAPETWLWVVQMHGAAAYQASD